MTTIGDKNALVRLLEMLPTQVAQQKRQAIELDLTAIGKYEHYRQRVTKPGWNLGDTKISCAVVLIKHLGISLAFFTGTDDDRQAEMSELLRRQYQMALSDELTPFIV
jgi:hypothetical protein